MSDDNIIGLDSRRKEQQPEGPQPKTYNVEYMNPTGDLVEETYSGFLAYGPFFGIVNEKGLPYILLPNEAVRRVKIEVEDERG